MLLDIISNEVRICGQSRRSPANKSGVTLLKAACSSRRVFSQSLIRARPAAVWAYRPGMDTDTLGTPVRTLWIAPASVPPPPGCRIWQGMPSVFGCPDKQVHQPLVGDGCAVHWVDRRAGIQAGVVMGILILMIPCRAGRRPVWNRRQSPYPG